MDLKKTITIIIFAFIIPYQGFADFIFRKGENISVAVSKDEAAVIHTALDIFGRDYHTVFGGDLIKGTNASIFIGTIGNGSIAEKEIDQKSLADLRSHSEGYLLLVKNNKIYVYQNRCDIKTFTWN